MRRGGRAVLSIGRLARGWTATGRGSFRNFGARGADDDDVVSQLKAQIEILQEKIDAITYRNSARSQTSFATDVAIDPQTASFEDLTKERNLRFFSDSARSVVDLISLRDDARPVGSFRYRAMAYPGDIDMCEEITLSGCNREDASRRVAERFANIARRISLENNIYLSDFKIGYDERLRGGVSLSPNVEEFDPSETGREIRALREHRLISERKQDDLLSLVDGVATAQSTDVAYEIFFHLRESIRQLYTLRWRLGELLIGRKRLADGTELPLWKAVHNSTSIMKVDTWAEVVDDFGHRKFTEITNYFILQYIEKDSGELKSLTKPFEKSYRDAVDEDIRVLQYATNESRDSMKLARRLWVRAVFDEDVDMLRRLYPLFQSPIAALSQIRAEAEVIRTMASKLGRRQGMILPVLDRLVAQAMAFNKRIRSATGRSSWQSISSDGEYGGSESEGPGSLYGIRERNDPGSARPQHLRKSIDSLLNPIYYEAKFQLADEGLHGGYVKETFCSRLARLEILLNETVESYTRSYLEDRGIGRGEL